jgi:hypothetical protein
MRECVVDLGRVPPGRVRCAWGPMSFADGCVGRDGRQYARQRGARREHPPVGAPQLTQRGVTSESVVVTGGRFHSWLVVGKLMVGPRRELRNREDREHTAGDQHTAECDRASSASSMSIIKTG